MPLAIIYSRASLGIDAPLITIEVHISNGLPGLSIVGMPETAVSESKDRVRSAIINSQFEFPARRITINLAPADLPKHGSRFDLAIAIGILAAADQVTKEALENYEFVGELALSGALRPVGAILPAAIQCSKNKRVLITCTEDGKLAAACSGASLLSAESLLDICQYFRQEKNLQTPAPIEPPDIPHPLDFCAVKGQLFAKRALEICAAGNHNTLLYGPPGTGKTMLASRMPGIMPSLTSEQWVDVACLYSLRQRENRLWHNVPFRKPHHSA